MILMSFVLDLLKYMCANNYFNRTRFNEDIAKIKSAVFASNLHVLYVCVRPHKSR